MAGGDWEPSATNDHLMGYGPVALHVAGTGDVKFRDISFHDLNASSAILPSRFPYRISACSHGSRRFLLLMGRDGGRYQP